MGFYIIKLNDLHKGLILILGAIFLQGIINVLFKAAALNLETFSWSTVLASKLYLLSLIFYFLRAICWQFVLKYLDLSFAYSFTSLGLILILALSHFYFNESISHFNLLGVLVIITGVVIVGRSYNPRL